MLPMSTYKNHMRVDLACSIERHGNNPLLTYALRTANLKTGLRWIAELANYQFSIRYSGKKHPDADYLSRNVIDELERKS